MDTCILIHYPKQKTIPFKSISHFPTITDFVSLLPALSGDQIAGCVNPIQNIELVFIDFSISDLFMIYTHEFVTSIHEMDFVLWYRFLRQQQGLGYLI